MWSVICSKNSTCNIPWRPRGRVEFISTLSLTWTLDRGGWPVPCSGLFTPRKVTWYPLYRRLWTWGTVWTGVETLTPHPGFDPQSVQPIAGHYINYTVLTHPSSAVVECLYQLQNLFQDRLFCLLCHDYITTYTVNLYLFHFWLFEVAKFRLHERKPIFSCPLSHLISDTVVFVMPGSQLTLINGTMTSCNGNLSFIHLAQGNTFLIHFTSETRSSGMTYCYLTSFNRDGIVQPCRIGEDGRPEPVGQVLELIEDLSRQQAKSPQDEDWCLIYIVSFTIL